VRKFLVFTIAAAVAFAPVGAPTGGAVMAAGAPAHTTSAMHHDHGAMQMAASQENSDHCDRKATRSNCCCDDKGACAQTCLMKCFGQPAVIAPDRSARAHAPMRFAALSTKRPPDWSSAPQPPPPRA
jgi:hypothetical protein